MNRLQDSTSILIVEDDRYIRESICDALSSEGFRVLTASNGKEALEMLRRLPPDSRPGLILLDLMMPVMDGWEFLTAQKEDPELKDIPVLVCSAGGDRAKLPEMVKFLKKPIDLDELISHVGAYCG